MKVEYKLRNIGIHSVYEIKMKPNPWKVNIRVRDVSFIVIATQVQSQVRCPLLGARNS